MCIDFTFGIGLRIIARCLEGGLGRLSGLRAWERLFLGFIASTSAFCDRLLFAICRRRPRDCWRLSWGRISVEWPRSIGFS